MNNDSALCTHCGYHGFLDEFVANSYLCPECQSDNWDVVDYDEDLYEELLKGE